MISSRLELYINKMRLIGLIVKSFFLVQQWTKPCVTHVYRIAMNYPKGLTIPSQQWLLQIFYLFFANNTWSSIFLLTSCLTDKVSGIADKKWTRKRKESAYGQGIFKGCKIEFDNTYFEKVRIKMAFDLWGCR